MTPVAIILILLSTLLHAGWNLIAKSGKPSPLFFLILTLTVTPILLPFLIIDIYGVMNLPIRFWYLLVATGFFQALYYTGLAMAYKTGDMSLIYPLIRSLPVLIIPLLCSLLQIGKPLPIIAVVGMVLIATGCTIMPLKSFKTWHISNYRSKALWWVIPGALGTVGYTIIDSEALYLMQPESFHLPLSIIYSALINLAILPWLIPIVIISGGLKEIKDYSGRKILRPIFASIAISLAYMLILTSMRFVTNVSYVAGFRQASIPLGLLLGIIILKEKSYFTRILGCVIITTGLILMSLF